MKVSQRNLSEDLKESLDGKVCGPDAVRLAQYLYDRYHIVEKTGYSLLPGGTQVAIDDDDTYELDASVSALQARAARYLTLADATRQKVLNENVEAVDRLATILFATSAVSSSEARDQAIELIQSGVMVTPPDNP